MQPKISIALATYNGAEFLPALFKSLFAQTLKPTEVIVSDDQSRDQTVEILQSLAAEAPFEVKLLPRSERLGCPDNFIRALRECSGEYVAWSDQDDVWHPDKLRLAFDALQQPGVQMVFHSHEVVNRDLSTTGVIRPLLDSTVRIPQFEANPELEVFDLGCTQLFTRAVADTVLKVWPSTHLEFVRRHNHPCLYHDAVTAAVAKDLGDVIVLPTPLLKYRRHPSNVSAVGVPQGAKARVGVLRVTPEQMEQLAVLEEEVSAIYLSIVPPNAKGALDLVKSGNASRLRASRYRARMVLRSAQSRSTKCSVWWSLLQDGTYGPWNSGGMGRGACVADLIACLFL